VLDGRAPYTDAPVLTRANDLLGRASEFFADPGAANAELPCRGVDHVLVATEAGRTLGMPSALPLDAVALDTRADLRLIAAGPGYRLYKVREGAPASGSPIDCGAAG
jgi:hypothetical protein